MITLTELNTYLKINTTHGDYANQLPILQLSISGSITDIETYCNRKLISGSYTEYIDGNGDIELHLTNKKIQSIESIYYDSGSEYINLFADGDNVSDYTLILDRYNTVKLLGGYVFPCGRHNVKIDYHSGYDSTTCLSDLKSILLEMSALKYKNSSVSGDSRLGIQSSNISLQSSDGVVYKDEWSNWQRTLDKYRLVSI